MQINIEIQEDLADTIVTIACQKRDPFIDRLIAALRMTDRQMIVTFDGADTVLDVSEILYIETVDKKCFIYTEKKVCETLRRLCELEQELAQYLFVRISRSCIANLKNIASVRTYFNRRLLITLKNGEQLIASRQYAETIKILLGVK